MNKHLQCVQQIKSESPYYKEVLKNKKKMNIPNEKWAEDIASHERRNTYGQLHWGKSGF
jgi:hypothetical protein